MPRNRPRRWSASAAHRCVPANFGCCEGELFGDGHKWHAFTCPNWAPRKPAPRYAGAYGLRDVEITIGGCRLQLPALGSPLPFLWPSAAESFVRVCGGLLIARLEPDQGLVTECTECHTLTRGVPAVGRCTQRRAYGMSYHTPGNLDPGPPRA